MKTRIEMPVRAAQHKKIEKNKGINEVRFVSSYTAKVNRGTSYPGR